MFQHQRNIHRSNHIQNSQQIQSQMQSHVQNHSQHLPQRAISSTNTPLQTLTNQSQQLPSNQMQSHNLQTQQLPQQQQVITQIQIKMTRLNYMLSPICVKKTLSIQLQSKKMRYFMAMFDYDPSTMSPNPDGCEEELPFQEGDTIKVVKKNLTKHDELVFLLFCSKPNDGFQFNEILYVSKYVCLIILLVLQFFKKTLIFFVY